MAGNVMLAAILGSEQKLITTPSDIGIMTAKLVDAEDHRVVTKFRDVQGQDFRMTHNSQLFLNSVCDGARLDWAAIDHI